MQNKFYITTTLPYINADPHVGYAWEVVRADAWARFQRLSGNDIFFNIGTDEHGSKIFERANELGLDTQVYCDQQVEKFRELKNVLNLSFDNFIRTTDEHHVKAAQEFWRQTKNNGYIYKKNYKTKYCVGCEMEKTDSELVDNCCPLHPNREIEIREEENYFFKFSAFQQKLLELYEKNPNFVVPAHRFNEIKSFVSMGLEDFSISRVKEKMPWGVPVPDDEEQVMYVWFDALVNYISAIGWPDDMKKFNSWWPGIQVAGKDNLRPQSAMWQAMLMAVNLPASKQIFINSFLTSNGQKMSKSLGNVISPYEMVEKFGIDGTRYILLSLNSFGDDADISWEWMTEKYNADLANGIGNLISRTVKLSSMTNDQFPISNEFSMTNDQISKFLDKFQIDKALEYIWNIIKEDNKYIEDNKPWELAKSNEKKFKEVMQKLLDDLDLISQLLLPFLPDTSEKIKKALETKQVEPLFQRIK
ncbi:MAG TPA: methionine--tRNA ligase [Candidatus Moranbacteria bacterium]|nr:methionine--tRNA ligase [Candidatus Moranbacteria bacterium]HRY27948.1 methionine--tRNA ligase [Candidatus Moranbacteria bacterium]HSA08236.1 methionine--tRNA ligase [Candidatus Moranbacteria bacterium]